MTAPRDTGLSATHPRAVSPGSAAESVRPLSRFKHQLDLFAHSWSPAPPAQSIVHAGAASAGGAQATTDRSGLSNNSTETLYGAATPRVGASCGNHL